MRSESKQGKPIRSILQGQDDTRLSQFAVLLSFAGTLFSYIFLKFTRLDLGTLEVILLLLLAVELLVWVLLAQGKIHAARLSGIGAMWLLFTVIGLFQKDVYGIAFLGYMVILIVTGFSLGSRALRLVSATSMLLLIIFCYLNTYQIIQKPWEHPEPAIQLVIYGTVFLLGGLYLDKTIAYLNTSLREVRKSENRYRTLFDHSQDMILTTNLELQINDVNLKALKLLGYDLDELVGSPIQEITFFSITQEEIIDDLIKERLVSPFEHQVLTRTGEVIDVENLPSLIKGDDPSTSYLQFVMRDLRSRKQVQEYLNEYKQYYQVMLENTEYAFFLLDDRMGVVTANAQSAALLGYSIGELVKMSLLELVSPEEKDQIKEHFARLLQNAQMPRIHLTLIHKSGQVLWVEAIAGVVGGQEGQPHYIQWVVHDMTDLKLREIQLEISLQEMETLAMTDPLTGLHNRRSIYQYAALMLEKAKLDESPLSLVLVDVDLLKRINDSYGHLAGDLALRTIADQLETSKRRSDAVGRWGGDEFLIIMPETSLDEADQAAARFCQHIEKQILVNGEDHFKIGVCMGVASTENIPENLKEDIEELIKRADMALYRAKNNGRGQVGVYPPTN